ncbi:MAG: RCC1 domain-containing protein [Phycisphaerales bacterium]
MAVLMLAGVEGARGQQAGPMVGWGENGTGKEPPGYFRAVSTGWRHSIAIRADGTLHAWGDANWQCHIVPDRLMGVQVIAVAAGYEHNVVLLANGTIDGWGEQVLPTGWPPGSTVPGGPPPNEPTTTYVAIAAGEHISVAIRSDGTLASWGERYSISCGDDIGCFTCAGPPVPNMGGFPFVDATPAGNDFVAVSATGHYAIAQRSNGTLVGWGVDSRCQVTNIPTGAVAAFSAGHQHGIALAAGTFAYNAWGQNRFGQRDNTPFVPSPGFPCPEACVQNGCQANCYKPPPLPFPGLIRVGGGYNHTIGQLIDRTLIGWGKNLSQQSNAPAGNFFAFSSNYDHGFAILIIATDDSYLNFDGGSSSSIANRFTASDVATFHQEWVAGQYRTDVDGNGVINGADYLRFVDLYSRTVGGAP